MNFVFIAGHLGKDPETRYAPDGTKVTTLVVATNSRKSGKEETMWWRVTIWGDRFDKMLPYLTKGKPVMVKGELSKPTTYVDKNGVVQLGSLEVRADSIHFSPFGKPDQNGQPGAPASKTQEMSAVAMGAAPDSLEVDEDDQIPF